MWESLIGYFELAIYLVGSAAGGSLGLGVFVVAATTRILTLPLTYRMAKRARARQLVLDTMREELAALKETWGCDRARLLEETHALYAARGLSMMDVSTLRLGLLQAPLVLALFQAIRRVVPGSALAAGSLPVAVLAGSLATSAVLLGNQANSTAANVGFAVLAAASAVAFTLMMGSGFGLYSGAFQGVSTLQGLLLRRADRKALVAAG